VEKKNVRQLRTTATKKPFLREGVPIHGDAKEEKKGSCDPGAQKKRDEDLGGCGERVTGVKERTGKEEAKVWKKRAKNLG